MLESGVTHRGCVNDQTVGAKVCRGTEESSVCRVTRHRDHGQCLSARGCVSPTTKDTSSIAKKERAGMYRARLSLSLSLSRPAPRNAGGGQ